MFLTATKYGVGIFAALPQIDTTRVSTHSSLKCLCKLMRKHILLLSEVARYRRFYQVTTATYSVNPITF